MKERIDLDAEVNVSVDEFRWKGSLKNLLGLSVEGEDLSKSMINQASWTAWFCVVLGKADTLLRQKDHEMDRKYSELYLKYYKELSESGSKATEAIIKASVTSNPEYVRLYESYLAIKEQVATLSGIVKGFEHRKDMLVQLSALKRRELLTGDYEDAPSSVDLGKVRNSNK